MRPNLGNHDGVHYAIGFGNDLFPPVRRGVHHDGKRMAGRPRAWRDEAQGRLPPSALLLPQGLLALEVPLDAFVEPLAQVDHRVEVPVDVGEAQVQPQPQRL